MHNQDCLPICDIVKRPSTLWDLRLRRRNNGMLLAIALWILMLCAAWSQVPDKQNLKSETANTDQAEVAEEPLMPDQNTDAQDLGEGLPFEPLPDDELFEDLSLDDIPSGEPEPETVSPEEAALEPSETEEEVAEEGTEQGLLVPELAPAPIPEFIDVFPQLDIRLPKAHQPVNSQTSLSPLSEANCWMSADAKVAVFFAPIWLRRVKTKNCGPAAAGYMQLTWIEDAFKNLKGDLAIRPIHHQREDRIEAHIFIAFLAASAGHPARRLARSCSMTHGAFGARNVRRRVDGRCAPAHDRRTHRDHGALHPAGERTQAAAQALENRTSRPATPPESPRTGKLVESRAVVQTI